MINVLELFKESQSLVLNLNDLENRIVSYNSKIKELEDEKTMINKRISEINSKIESITFDSSKKKEHPQYNPEWANTKKTLWALEVAGRTQSIKQIVNYISEFDEKLEDSSNRRSFYSTLSATISVKAKKSVLFKRYQEYEGAEWKYGLKEWFDSDGMPLEKYQ